MQKANTLIIFCDQHNAKVTGCYGNRIVKTPNIDRLAARGTLFKNAYTSNPICVPARASFATGEYASTHRYWDNCHAFAGEITSWGKRLMNAGVDVTTIGKLHYKDDSDKTFPGQRIPMNITKGLGDPLTAIRTLEGTKSNVSINQLKNAGEGEADYVKYDRRVAKEAVKYLKKEAVDSRKPWCLFVGFTTPHNPYLVPSEYINQYKPFSQFSVSKEWHDDSSLHPLIREYRHKKRLDEGLLSDEEIQKATAAYYGMVSFMDDMVGVVLSALKESGLEKNTRVIYLDDHGDCAGSHGLFFKGNMYEESVRIPMIVAGPDIPEGKKVDTPTSIVDIYPTLLAFYDLKKDEREKGLPGISLIDTIEGKVKENRTIYSEYFSVGYAHSVFMIRKNQYKLVYYVGHDVCQLFDLENDPDEKNDLGRNSAYKNQIKELKEELYKIENPEKLDEESLKDQEIMVKERGGIEHILASRGSGCVPFTPVPKGLI
ncbi:MAG: sulfatase-like hydrolase/transferase [Lachnospiraceae bacterium]